jgi:hypothetical protein
MKKLTLTAIAAVLVLAVATPAQAAWRNDECRYQYVDGHANWSQQEVKLTILCATHKFGVSTSTALYVARRESGLNQFADNPTSSAAGVYQHIQSYWPGRIAAVAAHKPKLKPLGSSVYNARSNVLAAILMASHSWAPWGM